MTQKMMSDFKKEFPLKKHGCFADGKITPNICVLNEDGGNDFADCIMTIGHNSIDDRRKCKYWKEHDNSVLVKDVYDWMKKYLEEK